MGQDPKTANFHFSRVLVTGGAGFIGSHLVRALVGRGCQVLNVDKLTYAGNLDSIRDVAAAPGYRFVRADIADGPLIARTVAEFRPDALFHLAAESHVDRSITDPAAFVSTNVVGTQMLLEASLSYWETEKHRDPAAFRFVHVSTDEVFGSLRNEGFFAEESPYAPNSPYAASKAAADHLVRAYGRTYGLPVVTANSSNNYGPNQFPEKLIPHMILNALAGKPLPIYGDGGNVRDWLHVEDNVRALIAMAEKGRLGESYLVGGCSERTNLQVVREICRILDRVGPTLPVRPCENLMTFVADRPGHDRRYAVNPAKIEHELGWRPQESFGSGLEKTVAWYLANPDWVRRILDGSYKLERLGLRGERK